MHPNKNNCKNQKVLELASSLTTTMGRTSTYPINSLILNRWSPMAMTGEELAEEELMSLFEAARWAPSGYKQPALEVRLRKENIQYWDGLFDPLVDFNKSWAKNESALVVVVSRKNFEHNGAPSPSYQCARASDHMVEIINAVHLCRS
jgi:nitroreductase